MLYHLWVQEHTLGEGATIFSDMTKTMLAALDKQMALPDTVQESLGSSLNSYLASRQISRQSEVRQEVPDINASQPNNSSISTQGPKTIPISSTKERINTLTYIYLLLRIIGLVASFYGYTDSVSSDNNPMIGLAYRYGPTIYAIDRVNGLCMIDLVEVLE